ncbi:MAG: HyaD/HybD family hydrogenase maturation endopeptidase [Zoogloeaceae bacterium]|jgi:hydrogenase maturation protease|nr:HyaD/HybD family hydrogenase maturation endopeptidase [Zoogloeaceae bacterium]
MGARANDVMDGLALPRTIVLGIGNVLWADEGFGVRAVEALHARWRMPVHVRLVDGGTQGLALLPFVEAADRLIVLDAVDFGLPPGDLCQVEGEAVPACLNARKMSLHQTGFSDVLACAQLKGNYPAEIVLIGVQPVELDDFGGSLRPQVKARLDEAVERAGHVLRRWGVELMPHTQPPGPLAGGAELELSRYEAERPAEALAHRGGDTRFWQPGRND